ncbi:MAG: HPF/RaiA family ribosome-associated protein [Alcaligenaceae bacterium]|nr:HPF/RaiA family ribosome-associated protein [Alcaligenaceae bacterium]
MQILINTDRHTTRTEDLVERVEAIAQKELKHQAPHLTRVEYHLSDVNSESRAGATDKRCLVEGRIAGMKPVAAEHRSEDIQQAILEATRQLVRGLEKVISKSQDHRS